MPKRKAILSLACGVSFLVLTELAFPQSIWIDKSVDKAIWLEIQKPDFSKEFDPFVNSTFSTSAIFLSARWRLTSSVLLRAEIPFVSADVGDRRRIGETADTIYDVGSSENQFGNPLVGIEVGGPDAPTAGEIGVRIPIVDDEHSFSSLIGTYTDFDRFEAFVPKVVVLTAMAKIQYKGPTGLLLRLRVGPAFFIPIERAPEHELFGDYSLQAGYQFDRVTLLGGFSGRGLLSESNVGNRFVDQFGLAAGYRAGNFIPGVHLRFPLDVELNDFVDFVFGVNVGYRLP
ncbi:MAG: hypothetical protein L0196_07635 [candidate division Zixibacteria bacterium]|nr:hypothetical protein [candidate division Zixibacteria bacterium]